MLGRGLPQLRLAHWSQAIVDDMEDIAVACIEHQQNDVSEKGISPG